MHTACLERWMTTNFVNFTKFWLDNRSRTAILVKTLSEAKLFNWLSFILQLSHRRSSKWRIFTRCLVTTFLATFITFSTAWSSFVADTGFILNLCTMGRREKIREEKKATNSIKAKKNASVLSLFQIYCYTFLRPVAGIGYRSNFSNSHHGAVLICFLFKIGYFSCDQQTDHVKFLWVKIGWKRQYEWK